MVEIDASAADRAAVARRGRLPCPMHDAASLMQRAADCRMHKEVAMYIVERPDIDDALDESRLPKTARRARCGSAPRALSAQPGVNVRHPDRQRGLAQGLSLVGLPAAVTVDDAGASNSCQARSHG